MTTLSKLKQEGRESVGVKDRKGNDIFVGDIVGVPYIPPFGGITMEDELCYKAKIVKEHGGYFLKFLDYGEYRPNEPVTNWLKRRKGEYIPNFGEEIIIEDIAYFEALSQVKEVIKSLKVKK